MKAVFRIAFQSNGYGVVDEKTPEMLISECLWDSIRYARGLSRWDRPYQIGSEPIPKIEVIENGEYVALGCDNNHQSEQKLGKWVDDGDPLSWVCSECGYRVARYNNTPHCPNCGVKMINASGEQDEKNN
jgi:hypothetical protein